jgi:hypothetical protein
MDYHTKDVATALHVQFLGGWQIQHENKLEDEIRKIYCRVNQLRGGDLPTVGQTDVLLAARILKRRHCAKIQGFGQVLIMQQCRPLRAEVNAVESDKCGFQSLYLVNF